MKRIEIKENNLNMVYEITDENEIKLLHFSNLPFDENDINSCEGTASFRPVEVLLSGLNRPGERHGTKYTYTAPGYRLKYKDMKDYRNETGRKLEILMEDKPTGLEVCSNIQFYDGISVIRSWTELKNNGEEDLGVEYVSSFALLGIDKEGLLSTDAVSYTHLSGLVGNEKREKREIYKCRIHTYVRRLKGTFFKRIYSGRFGKYDREPDCNQNDGKSVCNDICGTLAFYQDNRCISNVYRIG